MILTLSGRLWPEWVLILGLMTGVSWLTVRSRENVECEVVVERKLIRKSVR